MRMTNPLSKWSRQSSRMICLMAACGLTYACSDQFIYDDQKPDWDETFPVRLVFRDGYPSASLGVRAVADKGNSTHRCPDGNTQNRLPSPSDIHG